jgi:predicted nucleic acid-binding protein
MTGRWPRAWQVRHDVSFYDALYVALAEATGLALVTADARIARAEGPRCRVEVV